MRVYGHYKYYGIPLHRQTQQLCVECRDSQRTELDKKYRRMKKEVLAENLNKVVNKREEVLTKAKQCVNGERDQEYGSPENNFRNIANLWNDYLFAAHGTVYDISPKDVAMMMALLKVARIASGKSEDSYVDLAGYAACAAEVDG